jgi:hypothetical protein
MECTRITEYYIMQSLYYYHNFKIFIILKLYYVFFYDLRLSSFSIRFKLLFSSLPASNHHYLTIIIPPLSLLSLSIRNIGFDHHDLFFQ